MKNRTARGNIRLPNHTHHDTKPIAALAVVQNNPARRRRRLRPTHLPPSKFRWIFLVPEQVFLQIVASHQPRQHQKDVDPEPLELAAEGFRQPDERACLLAQCSGIDGMPHRQ